MNHLYKSIKKFAALAIAAICLAQGVWANTAIEIANIINTATNDELTATVNGATVNVYNTPGVNNATSSGDYLTFSINSGVSVVWRATLEGNISGDFALINISGGSGSFVMESGNIVNHGTGRAITFNGSGNLNIGGTISAARNAAIVNNATGSISVNGSAKVTSANISNSPTSTNGTIYIAHIGEETGNARLYITGGTVENTAADAAGAAIYNASNCNINISYGTVSAVAGSAIVSNSGGVISVWTGARISSTNPSNPSNPFNIVEPFGTIFLNGGTIGADRLVIYGGTVENTADGHTIVNNSSGELRISGGTVTSTSGYAIWNANSSGVVNFSGGTISATEGIAIAIAVFTGGTVNVSGGTVSATTGAAISGNGSITVSGGTISATTGVAISGGNITVSGNAKITSASTTFTISGSVNLNGGTVENTADGAAIRSSGATGPHGKVNVSSGTVRSENGYAITGLGFINISGGTVESINASVIFARIGSATPANPLAPFRMEVNISGGIVQSQNSDAIRGELFNNDGADVPGILTIDISGGTVTAATGSAINCNNGEITVSSNAKLTSANPSATSGTIHLEEGTLNISGGTVENTAAGVNGHAIYSRAENGDIEINVSGGTVQSEKGDAIHARVEGSAVGVNISGGTLSSRGSEKSAIYTNSGTVSMTGGTLSVSQSDSYAIYSESDATIILGGNPNVTGRIFTYPNKLSVRTAAPNIFNPGSRTYTLDLLPSLYVAGTIAVTNGANFRNNFTLHNPEWTLRATGAHLVIAVVVIPPSAPQNFAAEAGNEQVTLSWSAPANDGGAAITLYEVSSNGGASWLTASSPTAHTFTGLTNGVEYIFRVRAMNEAGYGAEAETKAIPRNVPGAPQNFTAAAGNGQVTLSWQAPANNGSGAITHYEVSDDDGATWTTATSSTGHIFTGLTNCTSYTFRVRAVNEIGSGASASASALPVGIPGAPQAFVAAPDNRQVALSWSAPAVNNCAIIRYEVSNNDGVSWMTASSATAHIFTDLTNGMIYFFRVRAVNDVFTGAEATVMATPYTVPGAPQNFTSAAGNAQVTLSWSAPASDGGAAISRYEVSSNNGVNWSTASSATAHTFTGLNNGVEYTFKVRAVNIAGNSEEAEVKATPQQDQPIMYAVNIGVFTGGSVSSSASSSAAGVAVTLTILPDTDYELESISAHKTDEPETSVPLVDTGDTDDTRAFMMPEHDVTVLATFKLIPTQLAMYTVTFFVAGGSGDVSATVDDAPVASGELVEEGKSVVFTATPDQNWTVKEWRLNGAMVGDQGNTYTLPELSVDATVTVIFDRATNSAELDSANPLRAWTRNGLLHVTGLIVGESLNVYHASGAFVYRSIAASDETDIPLAVQGLYIITNGNRTVRAVFE